MALMNVRKWMLILYQRMFIDWESIRESKPIIHTMRRDTFRRGAEVLGV